MTYEHQPNGRMTVMSLPDELRQPWGTPQELEVRLGGELIVYGLALGAQLEQVISQCSNPECAGRCQPREHLRLEVEIAPEE